MKDPLERAIENIASSIRGIDSRLRKLEVGDRRSNAYSMVLANYLALPGLRGFWPLSTYDENTVTPDYSGQGRALYRSGAPTIIALDDVGVMYYGGTGYSYRNDESGLDISGTETYIGSDRVGLTMGMWFYSQATTGSAKGLMGKSSIATSGYWMYNYNGDIPVFGIGNGSTYKQIGAGDSIDHYKWYFLVGRFSPSSELKLWVNDSTKTLSGSTVPASIDNNTAPFRIGLTWSAYMIGRSALAFLTFSAVSDNMINRLYQNGRVLFGV